MQLYIFKSIKQKGFYMSEIKIRRAVQEDMGAVYHLIKQLAEYEKAPKEVEVTVTQLMDDGFDAIPAFTCYVAEQAGEILGFALYYMKYSTWKGRCLYLEDFIVDEKHRGHGIGSRLFNRVIKDAQNLNVKRMEWQVLDWNKPAINFYKKYNAELETEWLNGRLYYNQLQDFEV